MVFIVETKCLKHIKPTLDVFDTYQRVLKLNAKMCSAQLYIARAKFTKNDPPDIYLQLDSVRGLSCITFAIIFFFFVMLLLHLKRY